MAKQRGLEAKLYFKKLTVDGGLFTSTPDAINDIAAAEFWEINTINNVEQDVSSNEFEFETRESVANITVPTSETDELTLSLYQDPADANGFLRLFNCRAATAQTNKVLGLAVLHAGVAVTPNIVKAAGNYIVISMSSGEPKSEGILVRFTLKPFSFTTSGFAVPAA